MDSVDDTTEKKPEPKVAYIGEGVIFKGELSAPELVVVDGSVEGELSARCVRVGVSGSLKGTVTVTDADIHGTVSDKLEVKQLLIVRATGRVDANTSSTSGTNTFRGEGLEQATRYETLVEISLLHL